MSNIRAFWGFIRGLCQPDYLAEMAGLTLSSSLVFRILPKPLPLTISFILGFAGYMSYTSFLFSHRQPLDFDYSGCLGKNL